MASPHPARVIARAIQAVLLLAVLAYPLDWAVWRVRLAAGSGMGQVNVSELTAAQLKGNKEELYLDADNPVTCSRSLFRHAGSGACWYLRRHPETITTF